MIPQKKLLAALVVTATVALAPAVPASASPVVLAGPDYWTTWGMAAPMARTFAPVAHPFWDNPSYDGNGLANVGYFISGTPGSDVPNFYGASPGAYMPYLGDGSTAFGVNFTEPTDISHLFSVTAWNDQFGLFNLATGDQFPLFQAWDTKGLTTTFFAPGTYGFYLTNGKETRPGSARPWMAAATTSWSSRARTTGIWAWKTPPTRRPPTVRLGLQRHARPVGPARARGGFDEHAGAGAAEPRRGAPALAEVARALPRGSRHRQWKGPAAAGLFLRCVGRGERI